MIDGQNFFEQPVKNNIRAYNNIPKIVAGQGDYYIIGCLLFYPYYNEHSKMIAIDLSKQEALEVNLKAIQQINFTENLLRDGNTAMFLIIEKAKKKHFRFLQRTVRVL